jgi:hypothetical protein
MEEIRGCYLADVVGLGKPFLAPGLLVAGCFNHLLCESFFRTACLNLSREADYS